MDAVKIQRTVVQDDGKDGVFYRGGERWIREHGKEIRLLELAPNLELWWRMDKALEDDIINQYLSKDTLP